jgi:predicted acylesterase/phospholipase RssA
MIKSLVISGGGIGGFNLYGAIKYLSQKNIWNINNIKSMYTTSIGSYIGLVLSLSYDWDSLDDYLIMRPWDNVFKFKPDQILNFWSSKGILDENITKIVLEPLLVAKELSINITMLELYNYNNIEFHIYTCNLNSTLPKLVDISYKTHPDLCVYKAIAMSSAIPILFPPVCDTSNCYIDGAIFNNFPLNSCINDNINEEEILAFKLSFVDMRLNIDSSSNVYDYLFNLVEGLRRFIATDDKQKQIENIIECKINKNLSDWNKILFSPNLRSEMINKGMEVGEEFYKSFIERNQEIV